MPTRYPHHNDSYDPDPPRWWHKPLLVLVVGLLCAVVGRCVKGEW